MHGEQGEKVEGTGGQFGGAEAPAPERGAKIETPDAQTVPTDAQSLETDTQSVAPDARPAAGKGALTRRRALLIAVALLALLTSTFIYLRNRRELSSALKAGADKAKEVLTGEPAKPRDPYAEAVLQVEADRGEATGRSAANVEIPTELKQYSQPRRFLAIQSAAAAEAGVRAPHDFAELAEMIRNGRDFVEAPRLGRGYVLYGVGLTATGDLTHYDLRARKVVPLFANAEELKAYTDGLTTDRERINSELKEFDAQLKQVARGDKSERARLLKETATRQKQLKSLKEGGELIAAYYGKAAGAQAPAPVKAADAVDKSAAGAKTAAREKTTAAKKNAGGAKSAAGGKGADKGKSATGRGKNAAGGEKAASKENVKRSTQESPSGKANAAAEPRGAARLFAEYALLSELARDFGGRSYDLRDKESAREFQARLLSFLRPPALAVLEELGTAYQAKFERPLPATSLVRTEEYQRLLRESGNPNAADVAPPPHTTGLAFDIYYRFMTAAEQEFVMGEIARLEREGRVEALRELRDHYHVFVFPEGRRPEDKRVDKILGKPAAKK